MQRPRFPPGPAFLILAAFTWLAACASSRLAEDSPPGDELCFRLESDQGTIDLRLDRAAAPGAFAALRRRVRGTEAQTAGTSPFDGAAFEYARPRLELRLAPTPPEAPAIEAELDAAAVGLDRKVVADRGEAMDALQFQLLPALRRPNAERRPTPTLEEWSRRFELDHDPTFLVGRSRQELLEAIGYRFRPGPRTLPATRGAVALVPVSPTEASLELALLLADHPSRTGRWVVVGEIVAGIEIAEAISLRQLASPEARDYRPAEPVVIRRCETLDRCPGRRPGGSS